MELLYTLMTALPFLAFFIALSVLTPSWHWVVGFIVVATTGLAYVWYEHFAVTSSPEYRAGAGDALGAGFAALITQAFICAVILYVLGLLWWQQEPNAPHRHLSDSP